MNMIHSIDNLIESGDTLATSSVFRSFTCNEPEHFSRLFDGVALEGIQLSSGKFSGSVVFALLDWISIHISRCAQSVEMRMETDQDKFLLCVCLQEGPDGFVFGLKDPGSWIYVLPPGGKAAMPAPENCTLLLLTVDSDAMLENEFLRPEAKSWFGALKGEGIFVRSKRLASQLREDVLLSLLGTEGLPFASGRKNAHELCQALISSILSSLSLEWMVKKRFATERLTPASERFFKAQRVIAEHDFGLNAGLGDALAELGSTRSLEMAFSSHVKMGPNTYTRVIRLHNARQKLRDADFLEESIGNVAAREGFWDWSRFTADYSKHFGEQPSETRRKTMAQLES